MTNEALARAIQGRWLLSHEESAVDIEVYRPASFPFPPARGRTGMDLRADGALGDIGIGPTDRPEEASGQWLLLPDGHLQLDLGAAAPPRRYEVVSAEPDKLVLRPLS